MKTGRLFVVALLFMFGTGLSAQERSAASEAVDRVTLTHAVTAVNATANHQLTTQHLANVHTATEISLAVFKSQGVIDQAQAQTNELVRYGKPLFPTEVFTGLHGKMLAAGMTPLVTRESFVGKAQRAWERMGLQSIEQIQQPRGGERVLQQGQRAIEANRRILEKVNTPNCYTASSFSQSDRLRNVYELRCAQLVDSYYLEAASLALAARAGCVACADAALIVGFVAALVQGLCDGTDCQTSDGFECFQPEVPMGLPYKKPLLPEWRTL